MSSPAAYTGSDGAVAGGLPQAQRQVSENDTPLLALVVLWMGAYKLRDRIYEKIFVNQLILVSRHRYLAVSQNGGGREGGCQYRPPIYYIILIMGTPRKVPVILENTKPSSLNSSLHFLHDPSIIAVSSIAISISSIITILTHTTTITIITITTINEMLIDGLCSTQTTRSRLTLASEIWVALKDFTLSDHIHGYIGYVQ